MLPPIEEIARNAYQNAMNAVRIIDLLSSSKELKKFLDNRRFNAIKRCDSYRRGNNKQKFIDDEFFTKRSKNICCS